MSDLEMQARISTLLAQATDVYAEERRGWKATAVTSDNNFDITWVIVESLEVEKSPLIVAVMGVRYCDVVLSKVKDWRALVSGNHEYHGAVL
jgi:hypothetical protein